MKTSKLFKTIGLCGAVASFLGGHFAYAMQNFTPYSPGITTGAPAGALPPPGFYFTNDNFLAYGEWRGPSGQDEPIKLSNAMIGNALLWVPGIKILGATYGIGVAQTFAQHGVDAFGHSTVSNGFFNTVLMPVNLSWYVGNNSFIGAGAAVYVPDGHWAYNQARTAMASTSIANNFWTFEPNIAYSYLGHGWDLTLNNVLDFNTTEKVTDYHSGVAYYLDATAVRSFGPWTLGLVGNYSKQFASDTQYGQKVPNSEFEQLALGPMVAYDFGRVTLKVRFLQNVSARNTIGLSELHISTSFGF